MTRIDWNRAALDELLHSQAIADMLDHAGRAVRDQARRNAASYYPASRRILAIVSRSGDDGQSAYADVGYDKDHPGFVLFFSEVGTLRTPPRPHLRPALDQTRL